MQSNQLVKYKKEKGVNSIYRHMSMTHAYTMLLSECHLLKIKL